nr:DUF3768 domain-containing protein [Alloyangia pacifica]
MHPRRCCRRAGFRYLRADRGRGLLGVHRGQRPLRRSHLRGCHRRGQKLWFKIDLYDESYSFGTDDPLDDARTRRVLTLLFPSEY